MPPYRILSLDGGGVRGILEAVFLQRIVETPGYENFLDSIDLIAGTSVGGILGLGLAAKLFQNAAGYTDFIAESSEKFFGHPRSQLRNLIADAKYDNQPIVQSLTKIFGDRTLGDIKDVKVVVVSMQLDFSKIVDGADAGSRHWGPKFFHNFGDAETNPDLHEKLYDCALYTSAAPTYLPIYKNFVDGGVVANNPTMVAIALAIQSGVKLEDIVVLSIGTGASAGVIKTEEQGDGDWGDRDWIAGLRIINLTFDGPVDATWHQSQTLLGERHHRIQPQLPRPIDLDNYHEVEALKKIALDIPLDSLFDFLKKYWPLEKTVARSPDHPVVSSFLGHLFQTHPHHLTR